MTQPRWSNSKTAAGLVLVVLFALWPQRAYAQADRGMHLALGLHPSHLIAFYLAANNVCFLTTYGTLLAAVSFGQTGTTQIGKYQLNHSFMLPSMVTVVTGIIIALALNAVIGI